MIGINPYFPPGQERIDDIPYNLDSIGTEEDPHYLPDTYKEFSMMTDNSMLDHMTDYADEFGDQKLVELVQTWTQHKMSTHVSTDGDVLAAKVRILREIMDEIGKLDKNKSLDYTMAITDMMIILLQKMSSL